MAGLQKTNQPNLVKAKAPSMSSLRRSNDIVSTGSVHLPDRRGRMLMKAVIKTKDVGHILNEVASLWSDAQASFLSIGQYLLQARDIITERIKERDPDLEGRNLARAIAADYRSEVLDHLPFGRTIAVQLESVAKAFFIENRFRPEEMPNSYSTAYVMVRMTDEELDKAREKGALNANVERRTLLKFREKVAQESEEGRFEALLDRRDKLQQQQVRIKQELERLNRDIDRYENGDKD